MASIHDVTDAGGRDRFSKSSRNRKSLSTRRRAQEAARGDGRTVEIARII